MTDGNLKKHMHLYRKWHSTAKNVHKRKNTLLDPVTELLNNGMYDKIMGSCKQN